jgi:Raf kinase inhibitor-like YbhB/YbcL family protein
MHGLAAAVLFAAQWASAADPFALSSAAFSDGGTLAAKHTGNLRENPNCVGENISPPLAWANLPAGTKSLALVILDPEGSGGLGVVHWVAYGIPAATSGFAEGEVSTLSDKFVPGKGSAGLGHYLGPCVRPATGNQHFVFTLIATDFEPGELPAGLTREELLAKVKGHSKGAVSLTAVYGRP